MAENILKVSQLKKYFPIHQGILRKHVNDVKALDGVSFELKKGETLGLVGESGCGKSTLGRTIIRLYEPTSGSIDFEGRDFRTLSGSSLREARKDIQMVFQDPFAALDPRMTIGQIIAEPLRVHKIGSKKDREDKAKLLLQKVGLKPLHINRYPHEFSGGQRQRISIARTIALEPKLVIADEPVSALDVSIQAQVLNLMKDLQQEMGLTYLFISHDLGVVEHMCDTIAVMYLGKIVEKAPRKEFFARRRHPYTRALISSIPQIGKGKRRHKKILKGEVPSPINPPSGCAFHQRCELANDRCSKEQPILETVSPNYKVACFSHDKQID